MKHFQYYLDNDRRKIDADALPVIRRWLNELFEYYYRKRSYFPLTFYEELDEDLVQYLLADTNPSKSERIDLFNRVTKKQIKNYSSFEKALIIYLKSEYKEVEPTLKNTQDLISGGSYKNVWNKYLDLKRYLNPEKKSTISKKLFKTALEKIIDDKELKKYHPRAKNILQNEI